jgi:hypothetical protein
LWLLIEAATAANGDGGDRYGKETRGAPEKSINHEQPGPRTTPQCWYYLKYIILYMTIRTKQAVYW